MGRVELHCKTNYSFLTGASHADELVTRAVELGYTSLAITDENSLAGIVRAYAAARDVDLQLIVGAELILRDAAPVVLWAPDRASYARLSKLITIGRRRAPKGECWLEFDDVAQHADGLLAGVIPPVRGDRSRLAHVDATHPSYSWHYPQGDSLLTAQVARRSLDRYRDLFGERGQLLTTLYHGVDDGWRIQQLQKLSRETSLPLAAAGDVLYHSPMSSSLA